MKEAILYKKLKNKKVQCRTCAHFCVLRPKERGKCGVRENIGGKLYALNYQKLIALHADPIEKKPFYHFMPASYSLSLATVGCNFACKNCFLPETLVICQQQGPIAIEKIFNSGADLRLKEHGAQVIKINPHRAITHKGAFQKIIHAFKHPFEGEIYRIKPRYTPEITCTPSHPFFVIKKSSQGIKKIKAKDLGKDCYLLIPKNYSFPKKGFILDIKEILLRSLEKKYGIKDIALKEKMVFIKFDNKKEHLSRFIRLDNNLARLLSYYCAKGYVSKLKNSRILIFSFGKKEQKRVEETKNLLKKIFGINASIKKEKTKLSVQTKRASLAFFFKLLCGKNAPNKKIPFVLNQAPKNIVFEFLKGYLECNGRAKKDNFIVINTASKKLALGIYWLWLKMGFLPSFYEQHPKIKNRTTNQPSLYYLKLKAQGLKNKFLFSNKKIKLDPKNRKNPNPSENNKYWLVPIVKISKENYSGWVYNIEVEKDHSYLANFISVGNCQNYDISQSYKGAKKIPGKKTPPKEIVESALKNKLPSIAYTYVEPTIFLEYALEIMKLAKEKGIKNVWVSNGFLSQESAKLIIPYLDAINIDIKSFSDSFYQSICQGRLKPVLETARLMKGSGVWVEITTLIIPTLSDSPKMLKRLAHWISKNLGPETPWHISQFSGTISWKLQDLPDTPFEALKTAYKIGKKSGLKYVYTGNVPNLPTEDTFCPKCNTLCIDRTGYLVQRYDKNGKCPKCGQDLNLIL